MEWLEPLETVLATVVTVLKLTLECIAVVCVALGLAASLKLAGERLGHGIPPGLFTALRLRFGSWLVLALEFQLAADIVATTIAPSMEALGKLAAVAAIRTFLNYFLQKELEAEARPAKEEPETQIRESS